MNESISRLADNIETVIVGKRNQIIKIIAAMIAGGHVLIEDVPGVGKTQLAAALARSVDGNFNRIQLTPDIMPSDITGFTLINPETKKFEYRSGVSMCNFLLADEINRASPKAQSSLLEIMEEQQVSIDGKTYKLPQPFMTLATQNPVETFGTYHLPEAQMDRFLLRISLGYPDTSEEMSILDRSALLNPLKEIAPVLTLSDIIDFQKKVQNIFVHQSIREFIIAIVTATRCNPSVKLGVSPRGSIALNKIAKAVAFISGREYVIPDDILWIAPEVLAHRIILSPKGKAAYRSQNTLITDIINTIKIPSPQLG